MKNKIAMACLLIVSSGLAWFGSGCASTNTLAVQQAGYPKDKVDAVGLFAENCVICHGKNGRARTIHGWLFGARNFTDARWQADTSDEEIIHAIETGPKSDAGLQKKLSPAEIEALAAYVRTFKPVQ